MKLHLEIGVQLLHIPDVSPLGRVLSLLVMKGRLVGTF